MDNNFSPPHDTYVCVRQTIFGRYNQGNTFGEVPHHSTRQALDSGLTLCNQYGRHYHLHSLKYPWRCLPSHPELFAVDRGRSIAVLNKVFCIHLGQSS